MSENTAHRGKRKCRLSEGFLQTAVTAKVEENTTHQEKAKNR